MKKFMLFASAVALVALSGCSNEDALTQGSDAATAENGDAISFGTYVAGQTRALNVDLDDVQTNGFGVFAYSTASTPIEKYIASDYTPNFMYNQKVVYGPDYAGIAEWNYTPVKYWPNNPDALVSFYAYAPYIEELTSDEYTETADNNNYLNNVKYVKDYNVRLQLGKDYKGPGIEYVRPADPTKGIDLLWGDFGKTGKAAVDQKKTMVEDKITFQFRHALSRIHFNVQVWSDETSGTHPTNSNTPIADNTTITIDKVELVGNFPNSGTLRLFDGSWNVDKDNYAQTIEFADTLLNKTCREGITADAANKEIDLLKGHSMEDGVQLDDETIDNFVMAIPTSSKFFIRLTYTVKTEDKANPKNNSTVTNTVCSYDDNVEIYKMDGTTADAFDATETGYVMGLEAGKAYDFHLNIGMTSVKFAADVDDWNRVGDEVDLPANNSDEY